MRMTYGMGYVQRPVLTIFFALGALLVSSAPAEAASTCSDCHGMPPIDALYRNVTTGGFRGSHQTHQPAVALPSNCEICHTGSRTYTEDHMDEVIELSSNIFNSPATATYSKGVFFNQTTIPVMGTCSKVNCHFEAVTPPWASAPLTSPTGCSTCHSAPPGDGNHPSLSGPGKKHGDYYGTGAGSCIKCHADHTAEAKPFAHATSVGKRGLIIVFRAPPNSGGSYSGNVTYPGYLPSRNPLRNGICSSLYCHSDGIGGAPKTAAVWGSTLPADCSGCHGGNASAATVIASGLHPKHINQTAFLGTNLECARCHSSTVSVGNDRLITGIAGHVDGAITVTFAGGGTYNAATQTCSGTTCHSAGKATAPQPVAPAWTGAAIGCNGCHGASTTTGAPDYPNAGAAAVLANSHPKHVASAADCATCHIGTTTTGAAIAAGSVLHNNGAIDVTFNSAKAGSGATWAAGTKSCSATSCHGTSAPVWGGALPTDCTGCHGGDSTSASAIATGKHTAHVNNPTILGLGNNFGCVECHAKTVSANRTISNPANHNNGFVDYSGAKARGSANYNASTKLCTNLYCHSNGNPGSLVSVNPPAWSSTATMGCNGCHGTSTTTGAPDYANGGAGSTTANSHPKHVAGAGIIDTRGCANCHAKTVSQTRAGAFKDYTAGSYHLNRTPNVILKPIGGSTGSWNGSTCSATYCHGAAASAPWGAPSLACNACHSANNALPGAHGIHYAGTALPTRFVNFSGNVSSATAYRFTCSSCHASGAGKATHAGGPANAVGAAEVFYGFTTNILKGSYTYGTTQGTDNGFKWTNGGGGCNTTYCHSNGQGGNGLTAVSWSTTAGSGTCVQCHDTKQTGATATRLSGKHDKHMNPASNPIIGLGNGLNCIDCHARTAAGNTTISDKSRHINKFIDYTGAKAGGNAKYNRSTRQCFSIYCHSNGNPGAIVYANPAAWNSAITYGCNGCHGTSSAIGAPDYANGGAGSATANSHAKHVAGAADTTVCSNCHVKSASMTAAGKFKDYSAVSYHLNGTPNVYFNAAKAGTTATWAAGTCNNVACHGGNPVQWGVTAVNCQDCHGNAASASVSDFGATFWNNGSVSKFKMTGTGSWADNGHGRPTASGNYAGSGNPPANFTGVASYCEWCHDSTIAHYVSTNPFRLRNLADATWGKNGVCMLCHALGSAGVTVGGVSRNASSAGKVGSSHFGAKHTSTLSGGQYCWDCHEPHGTGNTNQLMIRSLVAVASSAATGAPTTQSSQSVTFTLSATPTGTDYADSAAPFNGVCNACHTTTNHYTQTSGDGHNAGVRCTSCHSHTGGSTIDAFRPTADCDACHGYPPAPAGFVGTHGNYSSARAEDYPGGGGAHLFPRHVKKTARPSEGWANCTPCHGNGSFSPATHTMLLPIAPSKITIDLADRYKFNPLLPLGPNQYSGVLLDGGANATGSCFNVRCHFKASKKWSTVK